MFLDNHLVHWVLLGVTTLVIVGVSFGWNWLTRKKNRQIRGELQTILDSLEPVALIDTSYNIIRVNELYAAAVGRSYQSLIGRKCYKVHENRDSPCPGCQLYKALLERKPQLMPAVEWRREGHSIYYDISFHPVFDHANNVEYVVEVKKDITTLHNIKTTLEEQKHDLERKSRELADKNSALTLAYSQLETALDEKNQDLEMAREIQRSLLPEHFPDLSGARLWSIYEPIQQVGGDLYDYIPIGDHCYGIFIGDVSGHGLAAAFIAALTKLSLHNNLDRTDSAQQLFKLINRDLRQHLKTGHYLTAFYGVLDLKDNSFVYVRGSHPPPLVLRPDGSMIRLDAKGMLLGLLPDPEYSVQKVFLEAGDRLFLFTDGCFGLMKKNGEAPITYSRFAEFIQVYGRLPLDSVYAAMHLRMQQEVGTQLTEDDRTFIAVEITKSALIKRYRYLLHFESRDNIHRARFGVRREMDRMIDQIVIAMENNTYPERTIIGVCNSIQEVVMNSLTHGHHGDEQLKVSVAWSVTKDCFRFSITDKGPGFDPAELSRGKARRGNGLLLVRTYMDEVFIENNGRTISLFKEKT